VCDPPVTELQIARSVQDARGDECARTADRCPSRRSGWPDRFPWFRSAPVTLVLTLLMVISFVAALGSSALSLLLSCGIDCGASGIVFGLVGALLWHPHRPDAQGRQSPNPWWPVAAGMCLYRFTDAQDFPETSYHGHLGGLLAGLWCGALFARIARATSLRRPQPRRLAIVSLATAALIVALVPDNRWSIEWRLNRIERAEHEGRRADMARLWRTIEAEADPETPFGARALWLASFFHAEQEDHLGVRMLLTQVAPVVEDPRACRDLTALQLIDDPVDAQTCQDNLRAAFELDPRSPETLSWLAMLFVFSDDSTVFSPARARALARAAVREDRAATPLFLSTLASADIQCGDPALAIRRMRGVIRMDPDNPKHRADLAAFERYGRERDS
jgi:hypothetical protein